MLYILYEIPSQFNLILYYILSIFLFDILIKDILHFNVVTSHTFPPITISFLAIMGGEQNMNLMLLKI